MSGTMPRLIVAGDVVQDHHLYAGTRAHLTDTAARGTLAVAEPGGAALLHRLLTRLLQGAAEVTLGADAAAPTLAHAVWAPRPLAGGKPGAQVWRTIQPLGFGGEDATAPRVTPLPTPDVLVLADGGFRFRHATHRAAWHLPEGAAAPGWILLKTAAPAAQGELWQHLLVHHAQRLVVLLDIEDLRGEALGIPRGLSWESTMLGLRAALCGTHRVSGLRAAAHLVVTFGLDGALWLDGSAGAPRALLVHDAGGIEGEWLTRQEGGGLGYQTVFAAALAQRLAGTPAGAALDLAPALENGLRVARDLARLGHGPVEAASPPSGFPVARLAALLAEGRGDFARSAIPWPAPGQSAPAEDRHWTFPEAANPAAAQLGLARDLLRRGQAALRRLPHARFGALLTADRAEIETLRHLRARLRAHAADPRPRRPLNIGVFGPPGAGKSFGVKELAREVFGEGAWLEFNLAQFEGPADLHGAFHQIRDRVLAGRTPIAFWDEFDSQSLRWLQYLLAPMQDGSFLAGPLTHGLGKCVFVFAGGTKPSFQAFATQSDADFIARKGPDFVSRLDAHLDVVGPNPRDGAPDPGMALRRALLLRGLLRLGPDEKLSVEEGLLRALLQVPRYRHGSRSMEKLVQALAREPGQGLRRSDLPALPQLAMHVDPEHFLALLDAPDPAAKALGSPEALERMAAAIHHTWLDLTQAKGGPPTPGFAAAYAALPEAARADNRAAARRMGAVLSLAGLSLCPAPGLPEAILAEALAASIEVLAEAEHDGWMAQRAAHGWRLGPRDDAARLHPGMRPYAELPEAEKEKDRNAIRHYPRFAATAGLGIGWLT